MRGATEHLAKRKPRVLYVMLGETDEWAHMRRYDCYLEAAQRADVFVRKLWETLQSMPEYKDKTSLVLTTDHGRGATMADWMNHGKNVAGAEFVWMAVMGPHTQAMRIRENVDVTQSQIAATLAALVGEDYHKDVPRSAAALPGAVK
jgi:arylsulfatase A-like enzyme